MENDFEYDVTPFVTHVGGASEFNNIEKAGKELKDILNGLKAAGHLVIGIVGIETEDHNPSMTTLEDGFLIVTQHNPYA